MALNKERIAQVLRGIENPAADGDLVTSGALQWIAWCDTYGSVKLHMPGGVAAPAMDRLARVIRGAIEAEAAREGGKVDSLTVEYVDDAGTVVHTSSSGAFTGGTGRGAPGGGPEGGHRPIGGLASGGGGSGGVGGVGGVGGGASRVIAVGAGKGGVGKSTVAVNLAVGLARRGRSVGLLDGDIYGPSLPTMLGLRSMEQAVVGGKLVPFRAHGVKAVTIGSLVDAEKPLIWRGPMAHGAFKQLLEQTAWGELDDLIIDLPPGTGDVSLTMAQQLRLTGAVVVCTPQRVAQDDAVRAARMFQQLGIEVLGVVENMSSFIGDDGKEYDLFGKGGAELMAQRLGVPFLGALPITMSLRIHSDSGDPSANFTGADVAGRRLSAALEAVVSNVEAQAALAAMRAGAAAPTLTVS